ncbi:MAG: recombination protein O N-terminal domain-containing protein [Candidatus Kerfeldbacteria bacterium]|nr:recombination protein O N-terminal domain-containing protein [Candidatus Kerfeldbacteria bacterium]
MQRLLGLILNRRNAGNSDRRLVILSVDGKHDVRARGTQKLESKLAGSLEPLTLVDLTVVHGRSGEQVTGSSIRDSYRLIHGNLGRIAAAGVVAACADQLIHGLLDDPRPFRVVRETFLLIGRSRTNREVLLAVGFGLWNLLDNLGYRPGPDRFASVPAVRRLVAVYGRGNPNLVRRIRCSVRTARAAVDLALAAVTDATDRAVPAATFFRSVVTTRRAAKRR